MHFDMKIKERLEITFKQMSLRDIKIYIESLIAQKHVLFLTNVQASLFQSSLLNTKDCYLLIFAA